MISAGTMSVLESGPREAFLLAHLFGGEDKLQTAMVFAEFPKKVSTAKRHPHSHPSQWDIWNGNYYSANWHSTGLQHFHVLPEPLKNASSHKMPL